MPLIKQGYVNKTKPCDHPSCRRKANFVASIYKNGTDGVAFCDNRHKSWALKKVGNKPYTHDEVILILEKE